MGIMKYWTIGRRLTFGFAGVILITLCVSLYAFLRLDAIQNQAAALAPESLPGSVLMVQIAALSEREVALALERIKGNDAQEAQKADEELRENNEKLSAIFKAYEATVFGAEEKERFQRLNTAYAAYVTPLEEVLKLSRAQKDKEAYDLYNQQLQPVFRKFLESINDDLAYNKKAAETSVRILNSAAAESKVVIIAGISLSLILAVLICYSVVRAIKQPLGKMIGLMSDIRIGDFTRLNAQSNGVSTRTIFEIFRSTPIFCSAPNRNWSAWSRQSLFQRPFSFDILSRSPPYDGSLKNNFSSEPKKCGR